MPSTGNAPIAAADAEARQTELDGTAGPGPTGYRWGIPVGFARTGDGATAAAVGYVLSGSAFIGMASTQVTDAIELMSADGSASTRLDEARAKLAQLRQVLSGGTGAIRYVQAAMATRVEAFTVDRARVSVWSVGVLSRDGAAAPQAGWTISTFELLWQRDDWKIWSEEIKPGPTPDLNASDRPATAAQLDARLEAFTTWGDGR
jgi:hypothetical protein